MSDPIAPLHSLNPGKAAGGGRPCGICRLPLKIRSAVEERLHRGDATTEIFRWLTKTFPAESAGLKYDVVARHRRIHMAELGRAAKKLSDAEKMQRQQIRLARDVLADKAVDPASYFGPAAIAQDIAKTSARLDSAADEAYADGEHASLSQLSNSLLRAAEIRAKMGGSIADRTEVNLNVTIADLHARLDPILGSSGGDRQSAARALLGIDATPPVGLAQAADAPAPHARTRADDPTNPLGEPLTIDVERAAPAPATESLGTRQRG